MTLPASGTMSLGAIRTEAAASGAFGLNWLASNMKSFGGYNLSSEYNLAWIQRNNVAANCTLNMSGQCNCVVNCAAVQTNSSGYDGVGGLTNCNANSACNCNCNCDNRAWLQVNCNCAAAYGYNNCAYNCDYTNCNCNCNCSACGDCSGRC